MVKRSLLKYTLEILKFKQNGTGSPNSLNIFYGTKLKTDRLFSNLLSKMPRRPVVAEGSKNNNQ